MMSALRLSAPWAHGRWPVIIDRTITTLIRSTISCGSIDGFPISICVCSQARYGLLSRTCLTRDGSLRKARRAPGHMIGEVNLEYQTYAMYRALRTGRQDLPSIDSWRGGEHSTRSHCSAVEQQKGKSNIASCCTAHRPILLFVTSQMCMPWITIDRSLGA